MEKFTLKYNSIIFDPITFKMTKTEKKYIYKTITVAEYRKKWNV